MGKFDGILICTDLDGTLLRDDKSISRENLDAIEYFKENGGLFTIVTGRMPSMVEDICDLVKPNIAFGCINGGGVYDYSKKKYLWMTTLPRDVLELVECVDKHLPSVGIQVNTPETIYFCKENSAMAEFRRTADVPNIVCDYNDIKEPITKIVFGDEDETVILKLTELLNNHHRADEFDFIRSEKALYEILPKGISKAVPLNKMVELYNLNPDKFVAVGDYDNDVAMIKTARTGIAVANACENAKVAADYITVTNEESAIAKVIYDIEAGVFDIPS